MAERDDETELSSGAGVVGESGGQDDWHEGQSPVDDFEDSGDDASAEVDEDEVEADEIAEDAPPQKKGIWIPVIVGILAFAFAGTLAFFQFGGSLSSQTSSPVPVSAVLNDNAPTVKQSDVLQPVAPQDVSASDVSTLYAGGKASAGYGSSVDVGAVSSDGPKSVSSEVMTVSPAQTAAPQEPPVVAPMATDTNNKTLDVSSLKDSSSNGGPAAPVVAPSALNAAPKMPSAIAPSKATVDVSVYESKILGLSSRIESLEKALSQTTKQMEQMNASLANIQAAGIKSVARAEKAEKSKSEAKAASKVIDKTGSATSLLGEPQAETSSSVTTETPKESAAIVKEKTTTQAKTEKNTTAAKTEKKTSSRWVLRAATESTAWVSKGADSSELQQVEVGQSLSGIGKVKEIKQIGDRWEIIGTKGVLR